MVFRRGNRWVFRIACDEASSLFIVGDFNRWSPMAAPMRRDGGGIWVAELDLEPGTYHFRYRSGDGHWLTDWAAYGVARNHLGGWDSLLHVPPPQPAGRSAEGGVTAESIRQRRIDLARLREWLSQPGFVPTETGFALERRLAFAPPGPA